MGMYSHFKEQDVMKLRGDIPLNVFLSLREKAKPLIREDGAIRFCEWSGYKLEGYWYADTVKILKEIAKYIDCDSDEELKVTFDYEHDYLFEIVFKNKKVFTRKQIVSEIKYGELKEVSE